MRQRELVAPVLSHREVGEPYQLAELTFQAECQGILGKFFENTLVKFELRQGGEALETHTVSFYESAGDAAARLEAYLLAPPQMDNMKQSVVTRRSVLPVDSDEFGKLIYETWSVEIDEAAILARYGH